MLLLNSFISLISILLAVAFYTILERKILGYIQIRKGPNKVGFMGILQPFSDAIKLFNKTPIFPVSSNFLIALFSPALAFFFSLLIWPLLPLANFNIFDSPLNTMLFLIISSLSVYAILLIGWASNSKYSMLGTIRGVAQMISYEINFFIFIMIFLLLAHSYNLHNFSLPQLSIPLITGLLPMFMMWLIMCMAETNRSPFDFAEGESELVSGFNVEYMGGMFALIFLAEYTSMLILSTMTVILFVTNLASFLAPPCLICMAIFFLWTRGTFPRFRYDLLMNLNWKIFLPLTLFVVMALALFTFST